MVFLLGINFPEKELVTKALTSLYGISKNSRHFFVRRAPALRPADKPSPAHRVLLARLLAKHYIHPTATLGSLQAEQVTGLTSSLTELTIENDLKRKIAADITRLKEMQSYRGRRHMFGLPVRGQRTRSQILNAKRFNKRSLI